VNGPDKQMAPTKRRLIHNRRSKMRSSVSQRTYKDLSLEWPGKSLAVGSMKVLA